MEKHNKRGYKAYLKPSDIKNIVKGVKYSERELDPINDYLRANNITYTELVKRAIQAYINSSE